MKQNKNNSILTIMILLLFAVLISVNVYANCDMMAMIAKKGHYISWCYTSSGDYNDPYDFFQFLKDRSGPYPLQKDGYGLLYYKDDGYFYYDESNPGHNIQNPGNPLNQAWYQFGSNTYYTGGTADWQWELDTGEQKIMKDDTKASIVLGHDRFGTGNAGNHPFRLEINGKHYTFEHNGYVGTLKQTFYDRTDELHPGWFSTYSSNWYGDPNSINGWIDSELYFHYIVANIEAAGGDIIQGIYDALSYVNIIGASYIANFVLSDGFTVYVYRSTTPSGDSYNLEYKEHSDFWSIKTQEDDGTSLAKDDLAIISPYGNIEIINLVAPPVFVSGEIGNETWDNSVYITGDITVPTGITLNINSIVDFATHCNFNIEGDVNLNNGSELNLSHASTVNIDVTNAQLFLNWGSTITGSTPFTWEQTPPGHEIGGEHSIPGDRIIAKNGGMITTPAVYDPGEDPIIIESSSGEIWDGIIIEDPANGENDVYWFTNCDISGIQKVSMKGDGNLSFYKSDLYDAGGIIVRDDATLTLKGCNIDGWINGYGSCVIMDKDQDDVGNEVYGNTWASGIYLRYTSTNPSQIYNTNIHNNYYGCSISDHFVDFKNCEIYENSWFGITSGKSTIEMFKSNQIRNNGAAEFIGNVDSYDGIVDCGVEPNTIQDDVDSGGWDTYLLMATDWQEGDPQIDVSDNTFIPHDISRFCPPEAFIIDNGIPEEERILLSSAMEDMNNKNYDAAEVTLKQIITDYPESNEAVVAVKCLYFIENFTDRNFAEFRAYLDEIQAEYGTPLGKMKEDIKTKTYMNEEEFITAIDRLEEVINNPPTPDDSIYAMIDEGYCYLKLAEDSTRAMPVNCSVRPATFTEFQENVRDLESRLSFFNEPETEPYAQDIEDALLIANYPNPFNPETTVRFSIPFATKVELSIYDIRGQKVCTLVDNEMEKGMHSVIWNGRDNAGKQVSSGIYLYKLTTGNRTAVKKMLLLK